MLALLLDFWAFLLSDRPAEAQEELTHQLGRLISVIMLSFGSCEWRESIHPQDEQQLVKIESDPADEGD